MNDTHDTDSWLPEGLASVIATADPIPADVLMSLRSSLARRATGAEVAELVYDSVLESDLAGVRGGAATRQLTFETAGLSLDVEVATDPARLNGQVSPPQETDIQVRHTGGSFTVRSDALGHFRIAALPAGPISFACQPAGRGGPAAHTDWVVL